MSRIEDMQAADRWFKALSAKKKELADITSYKDEEIKIVNEWYERESKPLNEAIESMENELMVFYEEMRKDNPKAKLNTPYGKVTSRNNKKWDWADEAKILEYLKTNCSEYVNQKICESIDKKAVKDAFVVDNGKVITPDGEVLEGVSVSDETTYKVEVAG